MLGLMQISACSQASRRDDAIPANPPLPPLQLFTSPITQRLYISNGTNITSATLRWCPVNIQSHFFELPLTILNPSAWTQDEWTSSDDRVRGGSSKSTLDASSESLVAKFEGVLDITTLGGAGFASQRTVTDQKRWDLSDYDGIELKVDHADGKLYTLTLKDEILPKRPDGREQSTLSWEFDFRPQGAVTYFIKWSDFRPTYRGKDQKDVEPLDLKNIRRFGIMIRRFVLLTTITAEVLR